MKTRKTALPALLAEIAEVAGLPAALAIARVKGGARTHFPAKANDDHWLPVTVGREAADKLCRHFRSRNGGIALVVPRGPTNFYAMARLAAVELYEQGVSIAETARAVGVSSRAVETWRAEARATAFSRNEVLDLTRDARTVLGTTHHAIEAMPDILGLATIAEAQRHGEGQQGVLSLLKGMETSGATISPEKFHALADSLAKVTNVFGKTIDFTAWGQFFKYGGTATRGMSPDFIEQKLPHLIQELGGASTGTMFQSMQRGIVGGHMDQAAIGEMRQFGLLDENKIHEGKNGQVKLDVGAVRHADVFMRDPSEWVMRYLKPAMDGMALNEEERAHALSRMFSNRVSERGMSILENQDANIEKDAAQIRSAQGLDAAPLLTRQDPHLASRAAASRIKDLEQKAGEPVIGGVVGAQNTFSSALGWTTKELGKIPGAATALEGAMIAGVGYMGWKTWEHGTWNTVKGVLKGPEGVVRKLVQDGAEEVAPKVSAAAGAIPDYGGGAAPLTSALLMAQWMAQHDVLSTDRLLRAIPEDQLHRAGNTGLHLPGDIDDAPAPGVIRPAMAAVPLTASVIAAINAAHPAATTIPSIPVTTSVNAAIKAAFDTHEASQPRPVPTAALPPQTITNNDQKYITAPITVTVPVTINATLTNTSPAAIANTVAGAVRQGVRAGTAALHDGPETK